MPSYAPVMTRSRSFFRAGLAAILLATAASAPAVAKDVAVTESASPTATLDLDLTAGIESRTLGNGLEIVVIPDRRAPVVTHMIWYKAGAADEPPGKSGIAHYLEHLLFKGTPNVPAGEFSGAVAAIGGQENAFTSQDATAYFQRVPPEALPTMMAYEADRMVNLVLTEEMIATEREVIREERASRIDQSAGAELGEAARAALYLNHPYGTPIIGWPDEIDALTADDAIAFYERFYRPDNAVVVIAGDVDPGEVFALARDTYGRVEVEGGPPARVRPMEPQTRVTRTVEFADPRVSRPNLSLSWLAPAYGSAADGEAEALDLLAEILSGSSTSRLYRRLVVEDGVAVGAGAYYDGSPLDIGRFGLSIVPIEGVSLKEAEAAIRAEIERVAKDGVMQDELDRARDRMLVSVVFARDSQSTMARIIGGSLVLGATLDDIAAWPERMAAVTVDDVRDAARRFTGEGFVRSILRPEREGPLAAVAPAIDAATPALRADPPGSDTLTGAEPVAIEAAPSRPHAQGAHGARPHAHDHGAIR